MICGDESAAAHADDGCGGWSEEMESRGVVTGAAGLRPPDEATTLLRQRLARLESQLAEERAALAWAETVTRVAETAIPDADYQAARAVFNEKQLVDLTIAIGLMNTYNRIAIGFRNPPQAVVEHSAAA